MLSSEAIGFYRVDIEKDEIITLGNGRITFKPELTIDQSSSDICFIPSNEVINASKCGITLLATMLAVRQL